MLVSRLVAEGADREAAVRHSSAFVASLPPDEAAKIASLCEHSEDAASRIVASLKKRIDMQQRQTRQTQSAQKQQPTQMMPAQKQNAERQTPAQPQQQRQPQQQNQRQAQPIEHVRRMPSHLIDEDDDDDMINEFLAPSGGRQDSPAQNQNRVHRTPQAVRQQPIPQRQPTPQQQSSSQNQPKPQQRPQQSQQPVRPQQRQQPKPQNVRRQSQPVRATNGTRPRRPKQENAEKKTIYRPDPNANYQKFYLIFACTSPLWGFIALCVLGLFIIALAAMFIGIFVLIGLLFVGVAAGTVVALIGIIYGITQLFEYAPIGIYEIGLGIRVGGFVMLGGIIVYNTAVRLLPYLIRRELDLFTFVVHKCVELYYRAKGACADL